MTSENPTLVAFLADTVIARGERAEVATACKARVDAGERERIAVYDDETGRVVDLDLSGTAEDVRARHASAGAAASESGRRGPGRPKLGVKSREVSLLPRHWRWLAEQRGGASATLRRLVEAAARDETAESVERRAIECAHRFLWDLAGDRPGFEEASRALFATDLDRFESLIAGWPAGIGEQVRRYLAPARAARAAERRPAEPA